MNKAPDAFRTISEVADDLDLPQHVLRFWESRFPQVRPMKRGGGRRYYRPEDIDLLRGIRHLLYGEGYTIRGVQRILREQGLRTVQSVGQGRVVNLPEPSHENGVEPEIEATPRRQELENGRGAAAQGAVDTDDSEPPDTGKAGSRPFASASLQDDAAETEPDLPAHAQPDRAPAAAVPVFTGLAPKDLDRLKAALQGLEECRRLLDNPGNKG